MQRIRYEYEDEDDYENDNEECNCRQCYNRQLQFQEEEDVYGSHREAQAHGLQEERDG